MAKYTITIADIDLNIVTEESPEMVKTLVAAVDRRVRELVARNPRLTKSEAAILSAVDYCAGQMKSDARTRQMEHDFIGISKELESTREQYAAMLATIEELRHENQVMSNIITKSVSTVYPAVSKPIEGEQLTIKTENKAPKTVVEPKPEGQPVSAAKVMFEDETEPEGPPRKVRRRQRPDFSDGKNKVGDMFDMLTFKDV